MVRKCSKTMKPLKDLLLYLVLILVAIAFVFPFAWMVLSSLKTPQELLRLPIQWFPKRLMISNYLQVFQYVPFLRGLLNSSLITFTSVLGATLISALGAYSLAKLRFKGRSVVFNVVLVALMVPSFITLLPLYALIYKLGWLNTYLALIVPYLGSAYSIFLLRQYIITIPDNLCDAGRLDGANEFKIFWRVILPLTKPALVVVAFWNFFNIWNDFLWPLLVLNSPNMFTVQLVLSGLQGYESGVNFEGILMAGSVMSVLPTLVVYLLGQSQMKKLYGLGGVKG
jgi:multiple sugar transport system permease protein